MPRQSQREFHAVPHRCAAQLIAPFVGPLSKELKETIECDLEFIMC